MLKGLHGADVLHLSGIHAASGPPFSPPKSPPQFLVSDARKTSTLVFSGGPLKLLPTGLGPPAPDVGTITTSDRRKSVHVHYDAYRVCGAQRPCHDVAVIWSWVQRPLRVNLYPAQQRPLRPKSGSSQEKD